jgi:hypothetical protein
MGVGCGRAQLGRYPAHRLACVTAESRPNLKLQTEPQVGIDYDARRGLFLGARQLARKGDHDVDEASESECARCHGMRLRDCGPRNDGCGNRCSERDDCYAERRECR